MTKSYKNLYPQIYDFDTLLDAYYRARHSKRKTPEMRVFHFNLEDNLWALHAELRDGRWQPGGYRNFIIREPKRRKISAAPFRDRVVHHALCSVIQPLFERKFIHDSYANRVGKGTHAALDRAHGWTQRYRYVLKADIRRFFPSIDHQLLLATLQRTIACRATLALCATIIASGAGVLADEYEMHWFAGDDLLTPLQRARGLPIGNLTSQFWGNVYLDRLDHFIKERLRARAYVRYVDDFLLFGDDKAALWAQRDAIADELAALRLRLHPDKCHVMPTARGVPFLGLRLYPTHRRLLGDGLRRARRRLRAQRHALARGDITPDAFRRSLASWIGHAQHADTWQLRHKLLSEVTWRIGTPQADINATVPDF